MIDDSRLSADDAALFPGSLVSWDAAHDVIGQAIALCAERSRSSWKSCVCFSDTSIATVRALRVTYTRVTWSPERA